MKIGAKTSLQPERWETVKKMAELSDFIEVYYTKDKIELPKLLSLDTRWVVHAPHEGHGVNLADGSNINFFEESIIFAHRLGAKYIIIHSGYCNLNETAREKFIETSINNINRLKQFSKNYNIELLIENLILNYIGVSFIGSLPDEIKRILKETKCDFILDFSHVCLTSLNVNRDYKEIIQEFMKFKPVMFHISDGISNKLDDKHLSLGRGNFDLPFFISLIKDQDVTLEILPSTVETFISSKNYIAKVLRDLKT